MHHQDESEYSNQPLVLDNDSEDESIRPSNNHFNSNQHLRNGIRTYSDDDDDDDENFDTLKPSQSQSLYPVSDEPVKPKPSFYFFLALLYSFCMMGLTMGLFGPSLLELSLQVDESIGTLSWCFAARSVGLLAGTMIGGRLIDQYPNKGKLLLALCVLMMMVFVLIIPFITSLAVLVIVCHLHGYFIGVVDNLCQILLIRHYESGVAPYMQALHGLFGVGALISPLLLSPFLAAGSVDGETRIVDGEEVVYSPDFHWAWVISAFLGLPAFFWMLFYSVRDEFGGDIRDVARFVTNQSNKQANNQTINQSTDLNDSDEHHDSEWYAAETDPNVMAESNKQAEYRYSLHVVLMIGVFLALYVGCESGYGSYIFSFAVVEANMSDENAAYLNSCYWAFFAGGRMLGVPVSMYWSPQKMVVVDLIGAIVAVIILIADVHNVAMIWIGTILYGLAVGSIYASAINYCEHLVGVNGKLLSYLTFFACSGDAILPLLMGSMFVSSAGPISIMYICVIVSALATVQFCCLVMFIAPRKPKSDVESVQFHKPDLAFETESMNVQNVEDGYDSDTDDDSDLGDLEAGN